MNIYKPYQYNNKNMFTHIAYQPETLNITGVDITTAWRQRIEQIKKVVGVHYTKGIPFITIHLLGTKYYEEEIDTLTILIRELARWEQWKTYQTKITIIGHWYTLPGRLVEALKELIESTKDYETTFLNLCIAYDPRDEIVDATKNISRAVKTGKQDPEMITQETLRENMYTPHTPPPTYIIATGGQKTLALTPYDAPHMNIIFLDQPFESLTEEDMTKID